MADHVNNRASFQTQTLPTARKREPDKTHECDYCRAETATYVFETFMAMGSRQHPLWVYIGIKCKSKVKRPMRRL